MSLTTDTKAADFPIAIVYGGNEDGMKVGYQENGSKELQDTKVSRSEAIEQACRELRFRITTRKEADAIEKAIDNSKEPTDRNLRPLYNLAMEKMKQDDPNTFFPLKGGKLWSMPNIIKDQTDSYFIFGPKGCGKSYFTSFYVEQWIQYVKGNVFLISEKSKDSTLDIIPEIQRIPLDDSFPDPEQGLEDFKDSLVIFDDYLSIVDKKMLKQVKALKEKLMKCGRASNIWTITTAHSGYSGISTSPDIADATHYVVFPKYDNKVAKFLKEKHNLPAADIKEVTNVKSRWVVVSKRPPYYILCEDFCKLI